MKAPKNINYAATVVKITNIIPLSNCDNVVATSIMGNQIIVGKDVEIGEIGLFFPTETRLSAAYLKANNLYSHPELNADITKKGYFSDNGRIRCVKFRQNKSEGLFMPIDSLMFAFPPDPKRGYGGIGFSDLFKIGESFDEYEGIEICSKYVVPSKTSGNSNQQKKTNKISKLIEGQFKFHGDTSMLYKNLHMIHPDDLISITYKMHGTSFISSKLLCKKPLNWYEKLLKRIGVNIVDTMYDNIYASRKVVKNEELNPNAVHFYDVDIWGKVNEVLKPFLINGMTIYGEAVGYTPSGMYIQKPFDYGQVEGTFGIYIYRITMTNDQGKVMEYSMRQVQEWCKSNALCAVPLMYYGTINNFADMDYISYEDIKEYQEYFLQQVKNKYNEKDCFICKNKVPEEGVVIRMEKNGLEAYKCKSTAFLEFETKQIDKGETDIEEEN